MDAPRRKIRFQIIDVVKDATAYFGILRPLLFAAPYFQGARLYAKKRCGFMSVKLFVGHDFLLL
jgi:hypothetical protein